jgi:organic radical activating enzyme
MVTKLRVEENKYMPNKYMSGSYNDETKKLFLFICYWKWRFLKKWNHKIKISRRWYIFIAFAITFVLAYPFYWLQKRRQAIPFVMKHLSVSITTRCTLHCKACANLMQYYGTRAEDYDIEVLLQSLNKVFSAVDHIILFRIIGGEPLLYKNLVDIINCAYSSHKIGHIQVVTNGTILFPSAVLDVLNATNASVEISNYGENSRNMNENFEIFKKMHIQYTYNSSLFWSDYGGLQRRNFSEAKVKEVYKECNLECRILRNNEFHVCPRSAHGTDLGIIPKREADYILKSRNLRNEGFEND